MRYIQDCINRVVWIIRYTTVGIELFSKLFYDEQQRWILLYVQHNVYCKIDYSERYEF